MSSKRHPTLSAEWVDSVCYFSYDPTDPSLPDSVVDSGRPVVDAAPLHLLLERGERAWRVAIDNCVSEHPPGEPYVVPLSSGWDSRFVLGGLLAHQDVPTDAIVTYTFGVPGTWDYDIGPKIAATVDVEHVRIDLRTIDWSVDALRSYVETRPNVTRFFEGYCQQYAIERIGVVSGTIYSGAMAGAIAGSHTPDTEIRTWDDACVWFANYNRRTSLARSGYDPLTSLPDRPFLDPKCVPYPLQLDLAVRQSRFNRPIVEADGPTYRYPALDPAWLSFALSLPRYWREDQRLYLALLERLYPSLYALPSGNCYGLAPATNRGARQAVRAFHHVRSRITDRFHPSLNYLDWASALRHDRSLTRTIGSLLEAVGDRTELEHVDTARLWREQRAGEDRTDDCRVCACLELWLQTR